MGNTLTKQGYPRSGSARKWLKLGRAKTIAGWPRKSVALAGLFFGALLAPGILAWSVYNHFWSPPIRVLEVAETVQVKVPKGSKLVRLWVPHLSEDESQSVELLEMNAPWPHKIVQDPEFGNSLFYLEAKAPKAGAAEMLLRYRVIRKEQTRPEGAKEVLSDLYKKPRGLVVINDQIRRIARDATSGIKDPLAKAKALYYYVLGHVDYDTTGEGWGRGDAVYACRVGKGNCTDFHSLFIALVMAEDIPARFKIGYPPIPKDPEGKLLKPYHCWAEFHIAGKGWIPVDISEAWKNPSKTEYYFGNLDADRVLVSTGREIRLPYQNGHPLNYLARPYAEVDGKPLTSIEVYRSYKEVKEAKKT